MKNIIVTVPDTLTQKQELIEIVKQLSKPLLGTRTQKKIGQQLEIKHAETTITIKRVAIEVPIVTLTCSVCGTIFEKTIGVKMYTNYGGPVKELLYCSRECVQFMLDWDTANRFSKTKTKLHPQILW